jgi:hypothetical protein
MFSQFFHTLSKININILKISQFELELELLKLVLKLFLKEDIAFKNDLFLNINLNHNRLL